MSEAAETELRTIAMAYPEAYEDFPWGESAFKVRKKVFVFMSNGDKGLGISVKLPESSEFARSLTFCSPTGYGLGKHGWISARFVPGAEVPVDLVKDWIDESYRAVAPKKLIKTLPTDES